MNKTTVMIIFLPLMICLSYLMNLFTISSINYLMGGVLTFKLAILAFIFSISYIISAILEKKIDGPIFRALFLVASLWFGIIFVAFVFTLLMMGIDLVIDLPQPAAGIFTVVVLAIICIYSVLNSRSIVQKRITIPISGIEKPLTIVHVTDIHVGTILGKHFLDRVVRIINSIESDFVVITGDLVDGSGPLHHDLYLPLNDIKKDVYFIIGNHEIYEGVEQVVKTLRDTKLRIIRNEVVLSHGLQILGVEYQDDRKDVEPIIKSLKFNKKRPSMLLYHTPLELEILKRANISLHLAGHTHAGQIFPFNFLVRLAFPFAYGLHRLGDSYEYVSSGVGTWGPPMRLGCRSEIAVINLVKG